MNASRWKRTAVALALSAGVLGGAVGLADAQPVIPDPPFAPGELDSNGDGLPDRFDVDGDGQVDASFDVDGDGRIDVDKLPGDLPDDNGDGIPNYFDPEGDGTIDGNLMVEWLHYDANGDGLPNVYDLDGDGIIDPDKTSLYRSEHDGWAIPDELLPLPPTDCAVWIPRTGECAVDSNGDGLADIYDPDGLGWVAFERWDHFMTDHPNLSSVPNAFRQPRPPECVVWTAQTGECETDEGAFDGVMETLSSTVDAVTSLPEMIKSAAMNWLGDQIMGFGMFGLASASWLGERLITMANSSTSISLLSPAFLSSDGAYARMAALSLQLIVFIMILAVLHALVTNAGTERILAVVKDAMLAIPLIFVFPTVVSFAALVADEMFLFLAGDPSDVFTQIRNINPDDWKLAFSGAALILFFMGPLMALAALLTFVELHVVRVVVIMASCFAPLSLAAMVWPTIRPAAKQVVRLILGLLLVKPLLGLMIRVGTNLAAAGWADELGVGHMIANQVGAGLVVILMVFAPFTAMKLVPLAETALVAQGLSRLPGRGAMTAGRGARNLTNSASRSRAGSGRAAGAGKAGGAAPGGSAGLRLGSLAGGGGGGSAAAGAAAAGPAAAAAAPAMAAVALARHAASRIDRAASIGSTDTAGAAPAGAGGAARHTRSPYPPPAGRAGSTVTRPPAAADPTPPPTSRPPAPRVTRAGRPVPPR